MKKEKDILYQAIQEIDDLIVEYNKRELDPIDTLKLIQIQLDNHYEELKQIGKS